MLMIEKTPAHVTGKMIVHFDIGRLLRVGSALDASCMGREFTAFHAKRRRFEAGSTPSSAEYASVWVCLMSSSPITVRATDIHASGLPARKIVEKVVPDSGDPRGLRARYDLWVARRAMELLERAYPGHPWMAAADSAKGVVTVSLPMLMGGNWVYLIKWADLAPARVIAAGGELLERYRLPREKFDLARFLEARDKHSIVLGRARNVPD